MYVIRHETIDTRFARSQGILPRVKFAVHEKLVVVTVQSDLTSPEPLRLRDFQVQVKLSRKFDGKDILISEPATFSVARIGVAVAEIELKGSYIGIAPSALDLHFPQAATAPVRLAA